MENQGFEPRIPKVTDLQSAEVANASHSPLFGSPTWARTTDQQINSLLLYRLSYWGMNFSLLVFLVER